MFLNVTQLEPLGGHFAGWSILWLSGQEFYFSEKRKWLPLTSSVQINHTMHGFDRIVCDTTDLSLLMSKHNGQGMFLLGDLLGNSRVPQKNYPNWWKAFEAFEKNLEQLRLQGWKTVLMNDPDHGTMAYGRLTNLRQLAQNRPINDVKHRNQVIIEELNKEYKLKVDSSNVNSVCLHYMVANSVFAQPHILKMQTYLARDEVYSLTVKDLLDGDITVFESLLDRLGLAIDHNRCDQWNLIHRQWADANRFALTWKHNLEDWCKAIVNNNELMMPELDHIQLASLQLHLVRNHRCRLRTLQSRANAQSYHQDLRHTRS